MYSVASQTTQKMKQTSSIIPLHIIQYSLMCEPNIFCNSDSTDADVSAFWHWTLPQST